MQKGDIMKSAQPIHIRIEQTHPANLPLRISPSKVARCALVIAMLACLAFLSSAFANPGKKKLPKPNHSGIEHIVVVMMENRSYDHFLGWLPGADGKQAGLSYKDSAGVSHPTFGLAPDYQGCSHPDPDHSY